MMLEKKYSLIVILCTIALKCYGKEIPSFVPQGYHLDLYPHVDTGLLKGVVRINIATYAEPSNIIELDADPSIVIHYKLIKVSEFIKDAKDRGNRTVFEVKAVERLLYEPSKLIIRLAQKLQRDVTYRVHIRFESVLKNDSSRSFFMRTFFDQHTHLERKFVVMDLTKTGCRNVFPCFGRPDFKSWISLTVVRKPNFYALSTAPVNYTTNFSDDGSLVKDHFLSTPPMSLNSLALIVSDYRMINRIDSSDPTQQQEIHDNLFNSNAVKLVIKQFEDLFSIPFPLPSFHVVLVPREANIPFVNAFGLLIFNASTSYLRYWQLKDLIYGACDQWISHVASPVPQNSSVARQIAAILKNTVLQDIAKKLNMKLWNEFDDLQLNFISLIQNSTEELLSYSNVEEIFGMYSFNTLDNVYPGLLKETMHSVLRKKEYKMYTEEDIWNSINGIAKKYISNDLDLKQIVESWKKVQPISLVNIKRDYQNDFIDITQEPFVYTSYKFNMKQLRKNLTEFKPRWLPIVINQPSNFFNEDELIGWMSQRNQIFEMKSDPDDFLIVNPSHLGAFIVNYDERNWRMLVKNFNSLPLSIKLQLLTDSFILADAGYTDYSIFLNMSISLIPDEQHLPLWLQYYQLVEKFNRRFEVHLGNKYKEFIYRQWKNLFAHISEEKIHKYPKNIKDRIKSVKHRVNCMTNRTTCITSNEYQNLMINARMMKKFSDKHNCEIMKKASLTDWQIIATNLYHNLYSKIFDAQEKNYVFYLLSCTEHPLAFETYMNLLLLNFNKSVVSITENDQINIIKKLDYSQHSLLMNFIDKNFHTLKERLNEKVWTTLVNQAVTSTRTVDGIEKLHEFCNKYSGQFGNAEATLRDGLIIISTEMNWESEIFPPLEGIINSAIRKYGPLHVNE